MKMLLAIVLVGLVVAILVAACSRSNNLILGRVEARVGSHTVVVTDCYRTRVPAPQRLGDTANGKPSYRFAPCRDAEVLINNAAAKRD